MDETYRDRHCRLIVNLNPIHIVCVCIIVWNIRPANLVSHGAFFVSHASHRRTIGRDSIRLSLNSILDEWLDFQRAQTNLDLVTALVEPQDSLLEVSLVGQSKLGTSNKNDNQTVPCVVLSPKASSFDKNDSSQTAKPCLMIPVTDPQLKLLSFAVQDRPLSKSLLLTLNPLLVNRDGTLFDNIPWSTWTVDPQWRNRDAALNPIDSKYHLGKRDAFARFGGKDWKGRSVSIGNLAMRLKYSLQQKDARSSEDSILTKRIIDLQIREITEEMAEIDYQLAISRQNFPDDVSSWIQKQSVCDARLQAAQMAWQALENRQAGSSSNLVNILDRIADSTTKKDANAPPYRGAMGYAPMLDTEQDIESGTLPFTSPFGVMLEILNDQCKANVIGGILENTSLLEGTLTLGGAIVLQRITATRTINIAGEDVSVSDEAVDYGNTGVNGGETVLVECSADEAIGMALVSKAPLQVESDIWNRAQLLASPLFRSESENVLDTLPQWKPTQKMSLLIEGQARNQSQSDNPSPLRIPRTTSSLWDSLFESQPPGSSERPSSFPTDNPVRSLGEYDALTDSDKALTLMSMSNFDGKLPRPREVRAAARKQPADKGRNSGTGSPLDTLLLPLIDESVRRQFLIRDAERRQDFDAVRDLKSQKSRRQAALEMADAAKEVGDEAEASMWETEAEFYASLRADVSQDEGSYSRFMDQDEWYARDRLAQAKRIDKKKFGNLLDGIE